jgi:hypothetical protein
MENETSAPNKTNPTTFQQRGCPLWLLRATRTAGWPVYLMSDTFLASTPDSVSRRTT